MKRGFFITGTDTNVGKTVVSALFLTMFRRRFKVRYWKPIQTGIEADDDTSTVRELTRCAKTEIFDKGYRLEKPLSPHYSAQLAKIEINPADILRLWHDEPDEDFWIVEGAGGVFVPLNENDLMIDLIASLKLPVVVVARHQLGTINHTLLTIEALRNREIPIHEIVVNGKLDEPNRTAIENFGGVKINLEIPFFDELNYENLEKYAETRTK